MASGILGSADLSAATSTSLYVAPAGQLATVNISFCNRTSQNARVRLSVGSSTPSLKDYLCYDRVIPPNGEYERTGIVISPGINIVARAEKAGVSVNVYGFEETQS